MNPYYSVLGLPTTATWKEIRQAYLSMTKLCHPDKCKDPGAKDQFQEVDEAYKELKKFFGAHEVFSKSGCEGKTDLILTLLSLTLFSSLKLALFLK